MVKNEEKAKHLSMELGQINGSTPRAGTSGPVRAEQQRDRAYAGAKTFKSVCLHKMY